MAVEPLRGVLIGCGFFSDNHLNAWTRMDGVSLTGVCDLDGAKARSAAARFGIAGIYTDAAVMLETEKPDFVDIATTVASHRTLVELACTHAHTVICQKPFAETMADGTAMVTAAERAGANLIVHENFRWQRAFTVMKALVDEGRLGRLHFGRFSFRHGYDNYVNQPYLAEIERFTIMDVGLHLFDLARHFFGEVETLACTTQRLNPIVRGEDAFTTLMRHEGGATSLCDCSFYSKRDPDPFPQTVAEIEGDQGSLILSQDYALALHTGGGAQTIDAAPAVPEWGAAPWHGVQDSVIRFQAHAADVARGGAQPQPSGADNLKTLALALAAYDAAKAGTTIRMADWRETPS